MRAVYGLIGAQLSVVHKYLFALALRIVNTTCYSNDVGSNTIVLIGTLEHDIIETSIITFIFSAML